MKARPHYQHTQACKLQMSILHNIGPMCRRVSLPSDVFCFMNWFLLFAVINICNFQLSTNFLAAKVSIYDWLLNCGTGTWLDDGAASYMTDCWTVELVRDWMMELHHTTSGYRIWTPQTPGHLQDRTSSSLEIWPECNSGKRIKTIALLT